MMTIVMAMMKALFKTGASELGFSFLLFYRKKGQFYGTVFTLIIRSWQQEYDDDGSGRTANKHEI